MFTQGEKNPVDLGYFNYLHGFGFPNYKKLDYKQRIQAGNVEHGACAVQGKRDEEQDGIAISPPESIAAIPTMDDGAVESAYKRSFANIQKNLCAKASSYGSTCCSATAWIDEEQRTLTVWTANLGDSAAYAVIINQTTREVSTRRLTSLHNPTQKSELARLDAVPMPNTPNTKSSTWKTVGEYVRDCSNGKKPVLYRYCGNRLPSGLAVSRAFGDTESEESGLSHEPEIKKHTIELQEGEVAYLVIGCDGLTKALDYNRIGEVVRDNQDQSPDQIAETMVITALTAGSNDNIAVVCFQVQHLGSATVLDGHCEESETLVEEIGKAFYPTLQAHIEDPLLDSELVAANEAMLNKRSPNKLRHFIGNNAILLTITTFVIAGAAAGTVIGTLGATTSILGGTVLAGPIGAGLAILTAPGLIIASILGGALVGGLLGVTLGLGALAIKKIAGCCARPAIETSQQESTPMTPQNSSDSIIRRGLSTVTTSVQTEQREEIEIPLPGQKNPLGSRLPNANDEDSELDDKLDGKKSRSVNTQFFSDTTSSESGSDSDYDGMGSDEDTELDNDNNARRPN